MNKLNSFSEIEDSRKEIERLNISALHKNKLLRFLRERRIFPGICLGHHIKSWDVLNAYKFINEFLKLDAVITDFGCYASEILPLLHKAGYRNLSGIDTDPGVLNMPYSNRIEYIVSDYLSKDVIPENSRDLIVSISAIEHGYAPELLIKAVSKSLKTGGFFFVTFDYWPDKIDTTGITMFGRTWDILSDNELIELRDIANKYGLKEIEVNQGDGHLDLNNPPIHWANRKYTFGNMIFKKA